METEMTEFENLLESLVPGAGRKDAHDAEAPGLPQELGLEPRGILGRGGTGWVFKAWDPVMEREVAVKVARADGGAAARLALLDEARRATRLRHPAVLPVHRVTVVGGQLYVEWQLAPEQTLEVWLSDPERLQAMGVASRLLVLRDVARALVRAHAQGIVHGDLHPANIAIGPADAVYVLDWSGSSQAGRLQGNPSHAAVECLHGAPATAASDIFSLGAIAWELVCRRALRPRLRGEPLGAYVARWRARSAPPVRSEEAIDPELVSLIEDSLASAPDQRPSAEAFAAVLDIILSGASERSRREGDAAHCLARARELMGRHRELGLRIQDEQRVVAVLENKIPAHAPLAAKRSLWDAQQRVRQLDGQRMIVWLDAVHEATIAQGLLEDDEAARELRAELWATRLEDQSRRGVQREVFIAQRQVRHVDPDKRGRAINAPAIVDLSGPEDAQVTFFRFVARARQLVPEQVALPPLPWRRQRLEAGRYLVTVEAPGCVPLRYPLSVDPGERFHGELRPRSAQDVGEGFVFVPAGPFRLGGDLEAINPLDRCRPTLPDLFIRRDPVSNAEWKRFLDDLAVEDARAHVPGVSGLGEHWWPAWAHHEDTGWTPGPSWRMDGPVVGIPMASAEAYARWASQRTGRPLRLPTEEEWEKAARGVDGRAYPWGDDADPVFACIRHSRAGSPGGPAPIGAFPVDVSVYGCRDMAGNVREWTTSWQGEGEVVVRGGSWQDEMGAMRCAHRAGQLAHRHELTTGFRLVSEAPASTR